MSDDNNEAAPFDLLQYLLDRVKRNDETEQWRQDRFSASVEKLFDRYEAVVQLYGNFSLGDEQHRLEAQRFKQEVLRQSLDMLKQLLPTLINSFPNKAEINIPAPSTESAALASFFSGLSPDHGTILFGEIDPVTHYPSGGIFTAEQTRIFIGVARCELPPLALEKLIHGEHAVSSAQIAKVRLQLPEAQWAPLVSFLIERMNARAGA